MAPIGEAKGSKILVIDDDPDIVELLTTILKPQGFAVYHAYNGREGLKSSYELKPDLIVLDIMMPAMDGWDVCARLRELTDVPTLILTARAAEADMLRGFGVGADDYMKKPFSKAELVARVQALLRRKRHNNGNSDVRQYRDKFLNIDLETQVVEREGKVLDLSATEYNLLSCLVRNLGRVVTHSQLLREVWKSEYEDPSSLTLYICLLRKKIEIPQHNHQYIRTQWGRGYCFMPLNEI